MAKNYKLLFIVLCIGICIGYALTYIGHHSNKIRRKTIDANTYEFTSYQDSIRLEVQKTYRGESHVREKTGKNDGKRIEEYLASVNRKKGDPYCAAGVSWVFMQHDIQTVKSAWSPAWFPDSITIYHRDRFLHQNPDIADVLGIYVRQKKRVGHVGFIDEYWNNGSPYINTFEFNTSGSGSDEGEGNYHLRRLKSQIYKVSSPISKL